MTPSGAIEFANRRLLDYLGVGLDQLQDWLQFIHESDRSMMLERLKQSLESGQPYEAECRFVVLTACIAGFRVQRYPYARRTARLFAGTT